MDKSKDSSRRERQLKGVYGLIAKIICLLLTLCAFYWVTFGVTQIIYQRAIYLMLTAVLCFLYFPFGKKSPRDRFTIPDVILSLLMIADTIYVAYGFVERVERLGFPNTMDFVFGSIAVILGLEMVRRVLGPLLAALALSFILYAYFGPYFPDFIAHRGFSLGRITSHIFCGMEGIYGLATGVMSTFVLMFIIFGAFLEKSGISTFYINLSIALTKRGKGGPAKAAVVSSALMGSISGSAIANVLTTGIFTIPMMKKTGYRPNVAAAIEAAASTGGQILPPLMGAAAFVMVEFTGIPYLEIVKVAAIPALLYFFTIYCFVHIEAVRHDIRTIGDDLEDRYDLKQILKREFYLLFPIFFLIIVLMQGFSPMKAGFYGIIATVAVSMIRKNTRMSWKDLFDAMVLGARYSLVVGSITSVIGILIAMVGLTGIGIRFSDFIVSFSGGNIFVAIIFVILASFILGMGLPTTPAYIILAIFAGPSLAHLGLPLLSAHLLMLWYSIDSNISPPVALAAYTAAGVARSDPIKTMFYAFKYAKGLYIIPFLFAFRPEIILMGSFGSILTSIFSVILGLLSAVFFLEGFLFTKMSIVERLLYGLCAFAFFVDSSVWNIGGFLLFASLTAFHRMVRLKRQNLAQI